MAKPEWGIKRTCLSCGARFYDLKRDPITCPKCEAVFDPLASVRPRRTRTAPAEPAAKPAAPKPEEKETEDAEIEDDAIAEGDEDIADIEDDDDEDMIEDASELGEDEDDVADVPVKGDEEER